MSSIWAGAGVKHGREQREGKENEIYTVGRPGPVREKRMEEVEAAPGKTTRYREGKAGRRE